MVLVVVVVVVVRAPAKVKFSPYKNILPYSTEYLT